MTVLERQGASMEELSERQERRAGQFMRAQTSNRATIADIESRLQADIDDAPGKEKDRVAELNYALLLSEERHKTRLDDLKQLVRAIEQNLRTETQPAEERRESAISRLENLESDADRTCKLLTHLDLAQIEVRARSVFGQGVRQGVRRRGSESGE